MMRRAVLKGAAMAWVPGGVPPQRPDQLLQQLTRAGSGPAPSSAFIVARRVIIIGPTGGLFVYSPSPGAGNLVASITAAAGTDPYGNHYVAGVASYITPGETGAIQMLNNSLSMFFPGDFAAAQVTGGNGILDLDSGQHVATTDMFMSLLSAAQSPNGVAQAIMSASSATPNTNSLLEVQGILGFGGTSAATTAKASTDATGYPVITDPSGLALNQSGCQPASGNKNTVTATTFTNLAFGIINAGNPEPNAVYELEMGGYGTQGSTAQNLTLQARFGANPGSDTDVVGVAAVLSTSTLIAINDTFQWSAKVRAECLTSGAAATWRIYLTGTVTDTTVTPINVATISFAVGTGPTDVTRDSTAQIKMGLSALWGSAVGAPTITKSGSQFGRRG